MKSMLLAAVGVMGMAGVSQAALAFSTTASSTGDTNPQTAGHSTIGSSNNAATQNGQSWDVWPTSTNPLATPAGTIYGEFQFILNTSPGVAGPIHIVLLGPTTGSTTNGFTLQEVRYYQTGPGG